MSSYIIYFHIVRGHHDNIIVILEMHFYDCRKVYFKFNWWGIIDKILKNVIESHLIFIIIRKYYMKLHPARDKTKFEYGPIVKFVILCE